MTELFGLPFRADHVGSLLRPERLKRARAKFLGAQTVEDTLGPHNNGGHCTVVPVYVQPWTVSSGGAAGGSS